MYVTLARATLILHLVFLLLSRCSAQSSDLEQQLIASVKQQEDAWNQGSLEGFMSAYWKSEKLTFSAGGTTTRGWQATLARYKRRYPDKATMGKLSFTELEFQPLGSEAALLLGRWRLERDQSVEGNFSIVWRKLPSGWKIVHDHSSTEEP